MLFLNAYNYIYTFILEEVHVFKFDGIARRCYIYKYICIVYIHKTSIEIHQFKSQSFQFYRRRVEALYFLSLVSW